jgi:hypothetical protein
MAGIEFDRQMFAPAAGTERKPQQKIVGTIMLVVALGLAGLVGYKIFTQVSDDHALKAANAQVEQLQLQLADTQHQLEELEKHRKPAPKLEPPAPIATPPAVVKTPPPRPAYRVTAASALPPQQKPANLQPDSMAQTAPVMSAETVAMKTELAANHEAWQATTDRLADVVGVVGQQQNEISETREAVNQLLSQTRRQALSFELKRANGQPLPIGPVALQLKSVDTKGQRYSVCVYFEDRCTELKDRSLNEVVVFVVSKNNGPLELVATKILRDQVIGYLQVPVEPSQPAR